MLKLRKHQSEGIEALRYGFSQGKKSQLRQAPTGSGKTVEFSFMANGSAKKGKRSVILSDRCEILTQAGGSISKMGIAPGYVTEGTKIPPKTLTTVCMSQTLRRRIGKPAWSEFFNSIDLLIIDECHKQEFNPYFEEDVFKNALKIGFSATPTRSGKQRQLGLDYQNIIPGPSVNEMIEMGHLVPDRLFRVPTVDASGVEVDKKDGDYKSSQLYKKFDSPEVYSGLVDNWKKHAPNTTTLVFCVNIEHSIKTCIELNKAGISAKFLTSEVVKPLPPKSDAKEGDFIRWEENMKRYELYEKYRKIYSGTRSEVLNAYHSGDFKVLVNSGILTTGYDFPAIETIVIYRATLSLALWLQMLGRGARCMDGKHYFNLFDFGGNVERLGAYREPRNWYLWHEERTGGGVPPTKFCGESGKPDERGKTGCNRQILSTYSLCPFCGYKFRTEKELKAIELEEALYDIESKKVKSVKSMSIEELAKYRELNRYQVGWFARQVYYSHGGMETMEKALREIIKLPNGQIQRIKENILRENQIFV